MVKTQYKNLSDYGIELPKRVQLSNGGVASTVNFYGSNDDSCRHLRF